MAMTTKILTIRATAVRGRRLTRLEPSAGVFRRGSWQVLVLLCLTAIVAGCGLTAPRHADGFAELESLGPFDVDNTVTISIGPTLLHFAASHIEDDPELAAMLRGLDGIRIRVYEIDGSASRVSTRIRGMSQELRDDGWEPVALVREQEEVMHFLVKVHDGKLCGLTLLTSDGESEAVVINLMGEIQPEQFSEVMLALDVDAPGATDVRLAGGPN